MNENIDNSWERLGEFVGRVMDDYAIPGIAVGVLHKGDTFSRGFGVTNVDNPLPVTSETLFQIGSIFSLARTRSAMIFEARSSSRRWTR